MTLSVFFACAVFIGTASAGTVDRPMLDSDTFAAMFNSSKISIDQPSGRITMEIYGVKSVFAPGMDLALVGNEAVTLPARVEFESGRVMIPAAAAALVNSSAYKQKPAAAVPAPEIVKPKNFTVVLDPGHVGGPLEGGHGCGLAEYKVVFDVAKKTSEELKKRGFKVLLTRTTLENLGLEYYPDLDNRPALANETGADIFVSIHANESENPDAAGFEIFYTPLESAGELAEQLAPYEIPERFLKGKSQPPDYETRIAAWKKILGKKDAGSLLLAEKMRAAFASGSGDNDRGVKTDKLRVTKETFCPSVLVEIGFLSNEETAARIETAAYRTKLAKCLADGIESYWKETAGE